MSDVSNESKNLVEKFADEIKKNLPEWIKNDEEKLEDIIFEIKSHVWDSAYELAGSENPDLASVQQAIVNMGSPKEIANNYKSRGTPKFFISEELWPAYYKIVLGLAAFIFSVILIIQVVLIEPNNFLQGLVNACTLSYGTITIFTGFITVLFVYFSKEGFMPENFEAMDKKNKQDKKDNKFVYYKPGEHFFAGLFGFIFGLITIFMPIDVLNLFRIIINIFLDILNLADPINQYTSISPDLRYIITLMGLVSIILGVINVLRINSREPAYHSRLNTLFIFVKILEFAITVYMLLNIHLILEILPIPVNIINFIFILGILGSISEVLKAINQNFKLYKLINEQKN